jgi:hypothetical protein
MSEVYLLQIPFRLLRVVGFLVSGKVELEPLLQRLQDDGQRVGGSKAGQV